MAGEHIRLLRLLRLKNALRGTILSKEWIDLRIFHADCVILMHPEFWKLLFVMGRALYTPMRLLCLADQKTPAMDKLYYYVLQTDQIIVPGADTIVGCYSAITGMEGVLLLLQEQA